MTEMQQQIIDYGILNNYIGLGVSVILMIIAIVSGYIAYKEDDKASGKYVISGVVAVFTVLFGVLFFIGTTMELIEHTYYPLSALADTVYNLNLME